MKEEFIASAIIDWLESDGWETYKEVCLGRWQDCAPRADIVAIKDKLTWIIETKSTLSLVLLDQVYRIYRYYPSHYVSVGVGLSIHARRYHHEAAHDFLQSHGIGLLYVSDAGNINCRLCPSLRRRANTSWLFRQLNEEQKHIAAGTREGGYFTPFRSTVNKLYMYLSANPGSTLEEIMGSIKTHYNCGTTARAAIADYIRRGVITGIRVDKTTRPYRYYLDKQ